MNRSHAGAPLISVLMPTYNCRAFLAESIECILAQTVGDFEFIIVDDGSTDDSQSLLSEYAAKDDRIRVVRQENNGVGAALNLALEMARGKYLARLDADDRTPPERFVEQVLFLDEHPEIAVVGGWYRTFGTGENKTVELPTDPSHVKAALIFRNSLHHGNVMMRGQFFKEYGWRYSTRRKFPEDYDLWVTIAERCELANLPKIHLDYRIWPGSVCQDPNLKWRAEMVEIQFRMLGRMGLEPSERQRAIHEALAFDEIRDEVGFIAEAHEWLLEIDRHNRMRPAVDERGLRRVLTGRYIALYRAAMRCGASIDGLGDSPFRRFVEIPLG